MSPEIKVTTEIGTLRRLLIHSPDGGIGKIIPSKFKDWLYDDTVYLHEMQKEYTEYLKVLLYFLDREKIDYLRHFEQKNSNDCYKPSRPEYFNSDKVVESQVLLERVLEKKQVREEMIASVCAFEGCSYKIQRKLEKIGDPAQLAKVFISGFLPEEREDQFIFPPVPNFIFTRDIGITINDHLLLSKTTSEVRKRERILMQFIAVYQLFKGKTSRVIEITEESDFFLYDENEQKDRTITFEGGDIMMISPQHLLVGCSERTTPAAVNEIIHRIFKMSNKLGIEKISVIKIPKERSQMHIDTVFTQVSKGTWVLYGIYSERLRRLEDEKKHSYIDLLLAEEERESERKKVEVLRFYKSRTENYDASENYFQKKLDGLENLLIEISAEDFGVRHDQVKIIYSGDNRFPYDEREQWTDSCNLLALKDGVVVGYDRNEETIQAFEKNGFQIFRTHELFKEFESGNLDPQKLEKTFILLPSHELSRARGGSHCMSMPLLRDSI